MDFEHTCIVYGKIYLVLNQYSLGKCQFKVKKSSEHWTTGFPQCHQRKILLKAVDMEIMTFPKSPLRQNLFSGPQ